MEFDAFAMRRLAVLPSYVNTIIEAAREHRQEVKLTFTTREACLQAIEYLQAREFATSAIKTVEMRDGTDYNVVVSWK